MSEVNFVSLDPPPIPENIEKIRETLFDNRVEITDEETIFELADCVLDAISKAIESESFGTAAELCRIYGKLHESKRLKKVIFVYEMSDQQINNDLPFMD